MADAASRTDTPPRPNPKVDAHRNDRGLTARARSAANDAGERLADEVEANPLATLAVGIAVGLAAGALLPKSRLEGRYLGSLGAALNGSAATAARAASDAGKAELAAVGLSRVGANEQIAKLLDGLSGALRSAGAAARDSQRGSEPVAAPRRASKSRSEG